MGNYCDSFDESIPDMRTVRETAKRFGIAEHFARQLALTGTVRATRSGRKILINQASLADYFNSSTLNAGEEQVSNKNHI